MTMHRHTTSLLPPFPLRLLLCFIVTHIPLTSLATNDSTPIFPYHILATEEHKPTTFTQGWIKDDEFFYESSGHYERSFVQRYNTHSVTTRHLPSQYFAEGLTLFNDRLYLLTWKEETLFILNKHSLSTLQTLHYQGEGWGLTHNSTHLIMSNGTSTLFFRNPDDFSITQSITVKKPLKLNELEYVNGIIWANSWQEDYLYAINSSNGCLHGKIDLSQLREITKPTPRNVLNGIAYDRTNNGLWVTGKYWPTRYLISLPNIDVSLHHSCNQ